VDYEVFIHVRAWDFLQARMEIEGSRLQFECESLGKNPHREPDFVDHSEEGDIYGALIGQYAILYQSTMPLRIFMLVTLLLLIKSDRESGKGERLTPPSPHHRPYGSVARRFLRIVLTGSGLGLIPVFIGAPEG